MPSTANIRVGDLDWKIVRPKNYPVDEGNVETLEVPRNYSYITYQYWLKKINGMIPDDKVFDRSHVLVDLHGVVYLEGPHHVNWGNGKSNNSLDNNRLRVCSPYDGAPINLIRVNYLQNNYPTIQYHLMPFNMLAFSRKYGLFDDWHRRNMGGRVFASGLNQVEKLEGFKCRGRNYSEWLKEMGVGYQKLSTYNDVKDINASISRSLGSITAYNNNMPSRKTYYQNFITQDNIYSGLSYDAYGQFNYGSLPDIPTIRNYYNFAHVTNKRSYRYQLNTINENDEHVSLKRMIWHSGYYVPVKGEFAVNVQNDTIWRDTDNLGLTYNGNKQNAGIYPDRNFPRNTWVNSRVPLSVFLFGDSRDSNNNRIDGFIYNLQERYRMSPWYYWPNKFKYALVTTPSQLNQFGEWREFDASDPSKQGPTVEELQNVLQFKIKIEKHPNVLFSRASSSDTTHTPNEIIEQLKIAHPNEYIPWKYDTHVSGRNNNHPVWGTRLTELKPLPTVPENAPLDIELANEELHDLKRSLNESFPPLLRLFNFSTNGGNIANMDVYYKREVPHTLNMYNDGRVPITGGYLHADNNKGFIWPYKDYYGNLIYRRRNEVISPDTILPKDYYGDIPLITPADTNFRQKALAGELDFDEVPRIGYEYYNKYENPDLYPDYYAIVIPTHKGHIRANNGTLVYVDHRGNTSTITEPTRTEILRDRLKPKVTGGANHAILTKGALIYDRRTKRYYITNTDMDLWVYETGVKGINFYTVNITAANGHQFTPLVNAPPGLLKRLKRYHVPLRAYAPVIQYPESSNKKYRMEYGNIWNLYLPTTSLSGGEIVAADVLDCFTTSVEYIDWVRGKYPFGSMNRTNTRITIKANSPIRLLSNKSILVLELLEDIEVDFPIDLHKLCQLPANKIRINHIGQNRGDFEFFHRNMIRWNSNSTDIPLIASPRDDAELLVKTNRLRLIETDNTLFSGCVQTKYNFETHEGGICLIPSLYHANRLPKRRRYFEPFNYSSYARENVDLGFTEYNSTHGGRTDRIALGNNDYSNLENNWNNVQCMYMDYTLPDLPGTIVKGGNYRYSYSERGDQNLRFYFYNFKNGVRKEELVFDQRDDSKLDQNSMISLPLSDYRSSHPVNYYPPNEAMKLYTHSFKEGILGNGHYVDYFINKDSLNKRHDYKYRYREEVTYFDAYGLPTTLAEMRNLGEEIYVPRRNAPRVPSLLGIDAKIYFEGDDGYILPMGKMICAWGDDNGPTDIEAPVFTVYLFPKEIEE